MTDWNRFAKKHLNAGETPEAVANLLVAEAAKDKPLALHLIRLGAQQMARNALTSGRRTSSAEPIRLPSEVAAEARRTFLDTYKLFGGTISLGNATRKDLADSAREHDKQARGHDATAAFERDIGNRTPVGKVVADIMKPEFVKSIAKAHGL